MFYFFSDAAVQVESNHTIGYNNEPYTYVAGDEDKLILLEGFSDGVDDSTTLLSFSVYPVFQHLLHGDTLA